MTDVSICRREAPSVRSVANSRVRCAIVIESELAITKAPDEERDAAEDEQERAQERDELVRVRCVLLRLRLARPHLRRRREDLLDLRDERLGRDAVLRRDPNLVELARLGEELLRGRQGEPGERRAADRGDRAELDEARDAELSPSGPSAWTPISWPIFRSFLPAVDSSITTSPSSGQRPSTSERLLSDGCVGSMLKPRFGAPPKVIAFPSAPISWAFAADATDGGAGVRKRLHLGEQRLVERRRDAAVVAEVERGLAGDRRVGAAVDVREDRVERVVDRVREDERAAHHRDAEDDRERGQDGAQLAPQRSP